MIIRPRLTTTATRPLGMPVVNLASPLLQGLVSVFAPAGPGIIDTFRPWRGIQVPTLVLPQPIIGLSAQTWSCPNAVTTDLNFSGDFTVAAWVSIPQDLSGVTSYQNFFGKSTYVNEVSNNGWYLQSRGNTGKVSFSLFNNWASALYLLETPNQVTAGVYLFAGRVIIGSSRSLWMNGEGVNSSVVATMASTTANVIVDMSAEATAAKRISLGPTMAWSRALSDTELQMLYRPSMRWNLFSQPSPRVYFDSPAAPPATQRSRLAFMGVS